MFDLSGRVAMITGGNGGIGRGIALALAGAGASVAIVGRNPGKYAAVLQELEGIGRTALAPAISDIERGLGDIDILVNNAGIASVSG
jgi:NAD(P)-dependent dehydrogenase (short-subunit alcohol dehydrogenase family)